MIRRARLSAPAAMGAMICTLAAVFLPAARGQAAPPADAAQLETFRVPDAGIAPQAAVDGRGRLHLVYFKGDAGHGDIFYVRSDDGAKTFSAPLRVNSQPGSAIAMGTVRVPQLAVGRNGRAHVAWMGSDVAEPKVGGKAAPMLYARTTDAGDAFEPQRNLIAKHPGLDGGGSVAADVDGNVYVAWHAPASGKTEADRRLWMVHSDDDGKTFGPESPADSRPVGACGCCGMKIAVGTGGSLYVLYRSASETVNRDMILLASKDHARTFTKVEDDPWRIGACVMSTSAFGSSAFGTVGAWETKGHVRFAVISKGKEPRQAASVPGRSDQQKHPAIAANDGGRFVIAWAEGTAWNKGGSVAWQVFDQTGAPIPAQSGRVDGLPAWSMPAAFTRPDGTFGILY